MMLWLALGRDGESVANHAADPRDLAVDLAKEEIQCWPSSLWYLLGDSSLYENSPGIMINP